MCEACGSQLHARGSALTRRRALTLGAGLIGASAAPLRVLADASDKPPPKPENVVSPKEALGRLMEGNARYVAGVATQRDFVAERAALVGGQNPFAGVLSCADSRVAPEVAFDAGLGDIFVCRVAGNFVEQDNLASFEYAVDVLKAPLLMVLGHESCGAVKAAIAAVVDKASLPGHLPALAAEIGPAVEAVMNEGGDLVANATRENVRRNVEALKTATPILSAAVAEGRIQVVGGVYRLQTGQVELIG
ncbi:MAG: carbonic anhydrase [Hyphomicrobiales bacterium]|nr:carbonic anhydrase [Hyphomicrobiales bacterium]